MKATTEITMKFTIAQDVENVEKIIDPYLFHDGIGQFVADMFTDENTVVCFEMVESTMNAKREQSERYQSGEYVAVNDQFEH